MPRPSPRNNNPIPTNRSAGEAATWRQHGSQPLPRRLHEAVTKHRGTRQRPIERIRPRIERRPAEDVEIGSHSDGGEVAEAVHVGVARHQGERSPGESDGIEEERRRDGGILGEDAEEVREAVAVVVAAAEGD